MDWDHFRKAWDLPGVLGSVEKVLEKCEVIVLCDSRLSLFVARDDWKKWEQGLHDAETNLYVAFCEGRIKPMVKYQQ